MSDLRSVRPLADRIVMRELKREERVGSIIIPDSASPQGATRRAEILAVGPGKRLESGQLLEPRVKTGDKVLFGKYSGTEVVIDGEKIIVCREDDLLAVIEEA